MPHKEKRGVSAQESLKEAHGWGINALGTIWWTPEGLSTP